MVKIICYLMLCWGEYACSSCVLLHYTQLLVGGKQVVYGYTFAYMMSPDLLIKLHSFKECGYLLCCSVGWKRLVIYSVVCSVQTQIAMDYSVWKCYTWDAAGVRGTTFKLSQVVSN